MGIWGSKEKAENNYANEIALLNKKYNEVSTDVGKCANDITAFGHDLDKYKEGIEQEIKDIIGYLTKLNKDMTEFKKWQATKDEEQMANKKAKEILPDTLTYKEVCKYLKEFRYMYTSSFKYYLYECGLLDLKINPIHNSYKISENYASAETEVKKYIHVTDGAITFDKGILEYFINNPKDLQDSLDKYTRKLKEFHKSKENLSETQVKNYRKEIGKICGITDSTGDNYNGQRWGMVYKRYGIDHRGWEEKCKEWKQAAKQERPWRYQKHDPSNLEYLVEVCGDGDVLLKIACELFVA